LAGNPGDFPADSDSNQTAERSPEENTQRKWDI